MCRSVANAGRKENNDGKYDEKITLVGSVKLISVEGKDEEEESPEAIFGSKNAGKTDGHFFLSFIGEEMLEG